MLPVTDRLNSHITTAYTLLVFDFGDPEGLNKSDLEERARCPIVEIFDRQHTADSARRWLKKDFEKALSIYFSGFQNASGFDFKRLKKKLDANEKSFVRHLGKDKVMYLRLLISLAQELSDSVHVERPRGLLFEEAI